MEYMTPNFTKDMLKTHTILAPNMAPMQFAAIKAAMESEGYRIVMLENSGAEVAQLGLRYVHNDTCYPALLIIGQFLDALNSGKYDLQHTALLISQSGGGCRASNYIKLLRKALVKAGYDYIPVASLNASGLEKGSSMPISLRLLLKVLAAAEYGDLIAALHNQVKPYEINKGDAATCVAKWTAQVQDWLNHNKNYTIFSMKRRFKDIANDFAKIPVNRTPKVKVGVVGEIYVKFSPMGNNDLVSFLESQDCEVNMPGLMGYIGYCVANATLDVQIYGGSFVKRKVADLLLAFLDSIGIAMAKAMESAGFHGPMSFQELMKKPNGILSLGVKMGEGWLLTAEMIELIETGYENIVCAQPFGCLPNHIAGKGVVNRIRAKYPNANITAVDYDPSATKVNQENRIKLMLSVAKERLNQKKQFNRSIEKGISQ
ncbi:2-hydroxyacyl-CoA dehydratase [Solobacterium moorei]|uniref:2-hydroxyacyl-CoA dehydratase n=1 Tax=Solobacterium moorei TaxID=102148 RepID=UPI0028ECCD6C|nr:2-hydroxyacyl-CoA dehydratase [Solobacterium moorei]